jgi:ribokinase
MAESKAALVVVGRLWVESVAHVPILPRPGDTLETRTFEDGIGGRGARQAVAAARLGVRAALVSPLGVDDRADALLRWLALENVSTRLLRCDAKVSSGAALVHLDPWRVRQMVVFPEASLAISPVDVEAAAEGIGAARVVLVSLQAPREVVARAIGLSQLAHARILLDAAGAQGGIAYDYIENLDLLHATAREASVLTGVDVRGPATATAAAELIRARGIGAVLIDVGPDGHLLVTERGSRIFPRLAPDIDEAIGDEAFVAALAAGCAEGRPLEDAAAIASAAQALVSPEYGVRALPRRDAVLHFLEMSTGRSWELDEAA